MHRLLALAYFYSQDYESAKAELVKAIELDPANSDAYALLSQAHHRQGAPAKAKQAAQRAIEARPRAIKNYLLLASLYEGEGNWDRAREVYEKAHAIDPERPDVANNLAYLYLEHGGDLDAALSLARKARQKLPYSPKTAYTLGWTYYKKGLYQLAIREFEESVNQVPENPTYHYHLGMAYFANRQFAESKRALEKTLRLDPGFPQAASARQILENLPH